MISGGSAALRRDQSYIFNQNQVFMLCLINLCIIVCRQILKNLNLLPLFMGHIKEASFQTIISRCHELIRQELSNLINTNNRTFDLAFKTHKTAYEECKTQLWDQLERLQQSSCRLVARLYFRVHVCLQKSSILQLCLSKSMFLIVDSSCCSKNLLSAACINKHQHLCANHQTVIKLTHGAILLDEPHAKCSGRQFYHSGIITKDSWLTFGLKLKIIQ